MTLKDMIMRTSFNKVSPEVRRLLHGYSIPYTPRLLNRYSRAFERLRNMEPEPNVMKLYVMHHNINGFYDEDTLKIIRKDNPDAWEGAYSVAGTPWKEILGMEIDARSEERLSLDAIVANCLYEMLFMGFEEERESLDDRNDEEDNDAVDTKHVIIHKVKDGIATIFEGTTTIPSNYFRYMTGIETVIIPNSVTTIAKDAFYECRSISKVIISDIASWCKVSFGNSDSNPLRYAKQLFLNSEEITELTIPDGVTSISDYAFCGYMGLKSVTIPPSVRIIGKESFCNCSNLTLVSCEKGVIVLDDKAFERCSKLTTCDMPSSIKVIGEDAFYGCVRLSSLKIPKSVKIIDNGAFRDCSGLRTIEVDQDNPVYDSRDDCNAIIETSSDTMVLGCSSTNIPYGIKAIGDYAFRDCSSLVSVVVPNSVNYIGQQAFCNCGNLKSVILPNSLKELKESLFSCCYQLTSVVIPDSIKLIEGHVFSWCSSLVAIHIPREVAEIMPGQFEHCNNLVSITVDYENPFYDSRENCNAIIESKTNILIAGCNKSMIPGSVVELFDGAFSHCSTMDAISIPNSIIRIGDSVFEGCDNLCEIEIPESVKFLGYGVFYGCNNLKTIIICSVNTKPGYETFDGCPAQSILVPKGAVEQFKTILSSDAHDAIKEQN